MSAALVYSPLKDRRGNLPARPPFPSSPPARRPQGPQALPSTSCCSPARGLAPCREEKPGGKMNAVLVPSAPQPFLRAAASYGGAACSWGRGLGSAAPWHSGLGPGL